MTAAKLAASHCRLESGAGPAYSLMYPKRLVFDTFGPQTMAVNQESVTCDTRASCLFGRIPRQQPVSHFARSAARKDSHHTPIGRCFPLTQVRLAAARAEQGMAKPSPCAPPQMLAHELGSEGFDRRPASCQALWDNPGAA